MYVYVLDFVVALRSWVDVEQSEEYQEPPSAGHFEQQEQFEEGKYNMNIPITFKYNFILHFNIYIPWVAFWLVVLGAAL